MSGNTRGRDGSVSEVAERKSLLVARSMDSSRIVT